MGIVVGTTALNGPVLDDLRRNIRGLSADKRALEADVVQQRSSLQSADDFARAVAPGLVRGSLVDRRVLLVTTPGAPAQVPEAMALLLKQAGAQVAGTLTVLPALSAPESRQLVEDLVTQVLPPGVELPDTEPGERAAVLLAAALTAGGERKALEPADSQAVVSAFEEADLVQFAGTAETLQAATLAVVVSDGARVTAQLDDEDRAALEAQREALVGLAAALDRRSDGAVLAATTGSAEEGGTVRALRDDAGVAGRVSTVDNADRGTGQVAVVLALGQQLAGASGQYGSGPGATAPLPERAPA